jgi:hypothetical protein
MKNLTICEIGTGTDKKRYVRINKTLAHRAYNMGLTLFMTACKLQPFSDWGTTLEVSGHARDIQTFNEYVNEFSMYNCSYATGTYIVFHVNLTDYAKVTGRIV